MISNSSFDSCPSLLPILSRGEARKIKAWQNFPSIDTLFFFKTKHNIPMTLTAKHFLMSPNLITTSPPSLWQACNTNCSSSQEQLFLFLFNTNYFPSFLTVGVFKGHFNFKFKDLLIV